MVKYYTLKAQAQAACLPGQVVHFTKGKGYWVYGTPTVVGINPVMPQGPFVKHSTPVNYPNASPAGTISGLEIENISGQVNGLSLMQWPPKDGPKWTVRDIIVQNIGNVPPTSNGTREAGIWIGQPADVDGIVADGSWESAWFGAMFHGGTFKNFRLAKLNLSTGLYTEPSGGVANLYLEHINYQNVYSQGILVPLAGSKHTIISEWWYPDSTYAPFISKVYPTAAQGKAGSCDYTLEDLDVFCPAGGYGIYLDQGTWGVTTQRITFRGPGNAYKEVGPLAGPVANTFVQESCTFLNGGSRMEHEYGDPDREVPSIVERDARHAALASRDSD